MSRGMRATQYQGVDFRPSLVAPEAGFTAMAYDKRSDSMLFVGQILDEQVMPRTQVMARTIPARDPALLRQPSPHAPRRPTWDHLGSSPVLFPGRPVGPGLTIVPRPAKQKSH